MNLHCVGNISYWKEFIKTQNSVLYIHHTFQKQTSLSQFEIVTAQGLLKLSVPTVKTTRKGAYTDVQISNESNWQIEHWRSIENAYQKSPFFIFYNSIFPLPYSFLF